MPRKRREIPPAQAPAPAESHPLEMAPIRGALALAVEAKSLRGVARELGLSPTTVTKLLQGAEPYRKTVAKLQRWCLERDPAAPNDAVQARAVEILLSDFPPSERGRLREELVAELRRMHIREGTGAPPWLARVP